MLGSFFAAPTRRPQRRFEIVVVPPDPLAFFRDDTIRIHISPAPPHLGSILRYEAHYAGVRYPGNLLFVLVMSWTVRIDRPFVLTSATSATIYPLKRGCSTSSLLGPSHIQTSNLDSRPGFLSPPAPRQVFCSKKTTVNIHRISARCSQHGRSNLSRAQHPNPESVRYPRIQQFAERIG